MTAFYNSKSVSKFSTSSGWNWTLQSALSSSLRRVPWIPPDRKGNRSQPETDHGTHRYLTSEINPRGTVPHQQNSCIEPFYLQVNRHMPSFLHICLPFYKLLKGNQRFEWNTECDSALKELKAYISKPPVLSKPVIWPLSIRSNLRTRSEWSANPQRKQRTKTDILCK